MAESPSKAGPSKSPHPRASHGRGPAGRPGAGRTPAFAAQPAATDMQQKLQAYLAHAFSFETFFLLFLVVGAYGSGGRIPGIPVDLSLLLGLMSGAAGANILRQRGTLAMPRGAPVLGFFILWAVLSLFWAPLTSYAWAKTVRMALYIAWAYTGTALVIGPDETRVRRFLVLMAVTAAAVTAETLRVYFGSTGAQKVLGSSYLGVGRVIGLGCCALLAFLTDRIGIRWKAPAGVGFLLMAGTMFVAGGRGPLLALAAAVFVLFLFSGRKTRLGIGAMAIVLAGLVVWAGSSFLPLTTVQRLQVLFTEEGGGVSASSRMVLMSGAVEQMKKSPVIGQGVGSFYHYYGRPSVTRDYPHNIFLETGGEFGAVGLALLLMFMALSVRGISWSRVGADASLLAAVLLLVFTFVNAQFTGDIPDNRYLFAALGLAAGMGASSPGTEESPPAPGILHRSPDP